MVSRRRRSGSRGSSSRIHSVRSGRGRAPPPAPGRRRGPRARRRKTCGRSRPRGFASFDQAPEFRHVLPEGPDDPFREEEGDHDDEDADDDEFEADQHGQEVLGGEVHRHGPEEGSEERPHAPDYDHREHDQREGEGERFVREDSRALPVVDAPGGPREEAADGEEHELEGRRMDPDRLRRILVGPDRTDAVPQSPMGDPVCDPDLDYQDYPDRVEPGDRFEPDVEYDALAAPEFLDFEDDVESGERRDLARDREVDAAEAQRDGADSQGEGEAHQGPEGDPRDGVPMQRPDAVGEAVASDGHEQDMPETHVSRQARDEVDRIREGRENQEVDDQGQEDQRHPARDGGEDSQEGQDSQERGPQGPEGKSPHRRIPSGRNRRIGISVRTATAVARAMFPPRNSWPTLMIRPIVRPPTKLPHIFPGPPRTTMTKLIGA